MFLWNDDLTDIRKRLQFIRSLGSFVKRVDVLKYHNLGASKYEQLGQKLFHPSKHNMFETFTFLNKENCKRREDRNLY